MAARTATAPGKVILFGEHAVVYGEPAIAVAVDLPTTVTAALSASVTVNGAPLDAARHPYLAKAVELHGNGRPVALDVASRLPEASGMGSSAAVSAATILALRGPACPAPELARRAFEVEAAVQGRASPADTSTATHGHAVLVAREKRAGHLWSVERGGVAWHVHHVDPPPLRLVIGVTGVKPNTGVVVAAVADRVQKDPRAKDAVRRIGAVVLEALDALGACDLQATGKLMEENHELLRTLGVSTPALERLLAAVRPHALGAKITGAGAGGSIIALTERPTDAARAIEAAGFRAFAVEVDRRGARLLP